MAKLFISQPMKGLTDQQILEAREKAIAKATEQIREAYGPNEPVQVLDSFFQNAPADAKPMWYLGESIKILSQADAAYFADGWKSMRGCRIENECACNYDVPLIIEEDRHGITSVIQIKDGKIINKTIQKKPEMPVMNMTSMGDFKRV